MCFLLFIHCVQTLLSFHFSTHELFMSVALTLSTQKSHRVLATASLEQVLQFSSQSQQTFTALRSVTSWPQVKSISAIVSDLHIYIYILCHMTTFQVRDWL